MLIRSHRSDARSFYLDPGSWGNNRDKPTMEPGMVVDKLIDIVSKNGNLLLNIPIHAEGTLDQTATDFLNEVGEWMDINGDAIYGTRPWAVFGKGYGTIKPHDLKSCLKATDIRYTTKDGVLYAFIMDWPEKGKPIVMEFVTEIFQPGLQHPSGKIECVELLGSQEDLQWNPNGNGLKVTMPEKRPCEHAYVLKISFE